MSIGPTWIPVYWLNSAWILFFTPSVSAFGCSCISILREISTLIFISIVGINNQIIYCIAKVVAIGKWNVFVFSWMLISAYVGKRWRDNRVIAKVSHFILVTVFQLYFRYSTTLSFTFLFLNYSVCFFELLKSLFFNRNRRQMNDCFCNQVACNKLRNRRGLNRIGNEVIYAQQ